MINLIISALLPVIIILAIGYIAGVHKDFDKSDANKFNGLVMTYTLPLLLFCSIIRLPIPELIAQKDLMLVLFLGMVGVFWIAIFVLHYAFKMNWGVASLYALSVACPSAAFIGAPILGTVFGSISAVSIAIISLYMNLFLVPPTILFLTSDQSQSSTDGNNSTFSFKSNLLHTVKQPLIILPLVALVLALFKIKFPASVISSLDLLGKTTAGISLFAAGVILYAYKVKVTKATLIVTLFRNLIVPATMWGFVLLIGFPKYIVQESIVTLAIPTATIALILSIKYEVKQQEMATILLVSTVVSIFTMGMFIAFLM